MNDSEDDDEMDYLQAAEKNDKESGLNKQIDKMIHASKFSRIKGQVVNKIEKDMKEEILHQLITDFKCYKINKIMDNMEVDIKS